MDTGVTWWAQWSGTRRSGWRSVGRSVVSGGLAGGHLIPQGLRLPLPTFLPQDLPFGLELSSSEKEIREGFSRKALVHRFDEVKDVEFYTRPE